MFRWTPHPVSYSGSRLFLLYHYYRVWVPPNISCLIDSKGLALVFNGNIGKDHGSYYSYIMIRYISTYWDSIGALQRMLPQ